MAPAADKPEASAPEASSKPEPKPKPESRAPAAVVKPAAVVGHAPNEDFVPKLVQPGKVETAPSTPTASKPVSSDS